MKMKRKIFLVVIVLSIFLCCFSTIHASENLNKKLKVAFLYETTVGDFGWFYNHNEARIKVNDALDFVETTPVESVIPGAMAERVIKELCDEGFDVINATGSQFEADVVKVAKNYPNVKFLICSGTVSTDNIESFWPDRTQIWYMQGQIAGMQMRFSRIAGS